MTTNKFWETPGFKQHIKSDVTKQYVDNKFITLSTNLNTKVNRIGDTFSGNLDMGTNKISSSHVPIDDYDLVNKKYIQTLSTPTGDISGIAITANLNGKVNRGGDVMSGNLEMGNNRIISTRVPVLDDDVINKKHFDHHLAHRLNDDDMRIILNNLSLKANKAGEVFTGNLDLGFNKITSSYIATDDFDLINKRYLSRHFARNGSGHIPDLNKNLNNKSGFIVSASSETTGYPAFHIFTNWRGEWRPSSKENMYIQIQCPQGFRLCQFALRGRDSGTDRIFKWRLEASSDAITWATLYSGHNIYLSNTVQFFEPRISPVAAYYKIIVVESEGTYPGLSYFQLFSYNKIEQPYLAEIVADPRT